jgi:ankyrin repeat protein
VVGHYDSVKLLVEGGANIDITEERGLTALDFAEDRGYDDIATLLKKAGATRVDDASSPCCWTCVQASETPDKKLVCTLDFRNVKVVSRNHLCSAYEKRVE